MLSTSAAGSHLLSADFLGINVVITIWIIEIQWTVLATSRLGKTGEDHDTDGTGVRTAFRFCGRDSLHPMYARFGPKNVVTAFGLHLHNRLGEALLHGSRFHVLFQDAGAKPPPGAKSSVHSEEFKGKEPRLITASTGPDFNQTRKVRKRVAWNKGLL